MRLKLYLDDKGYLVTNRWMELYQIQRIPIIQTAPLSYNLASNGWVYVPIQFFIRKVDGVVLCSPNYTDGIRCRTILDPDDVLLTKHGVLLSLEKDYGTVMKAQFTEPPLEEYNVR